MLLPIWLPVDDDGSLYIGGTDHQCAPYRLQYNVATVTGGDSWHATEDCNYRKRKGYRFSITIYLSEINQPNLQVLASDILSPWPVKGDAAWFAAQKGRNLTQDAGRSPLMIRDQSDDCHQVQDLCESDLRGVRHRCPRTCKVYMEEQEYMTNLKALLDEEKSERRIA